MKSINGHLHVQKEVCNRSRDRIKVVHPKTSLMLGKSSVTATPHLQQLC